MQFVDTLIIVTSEILYVNKVCYEKEQIINWLFSKIYTSCVKQKMSRKILNTLTESFWCVEEIYILPSFNKAKLKIDVLKLYMKKIHINTYTCMINENLF